MKKQIVAGVESFEKTVNGNYFYIDKTLFIKELLENRGEVTLITRPRRFGKTMNMSMLKSFFDVSIDSKVLFEGLEISKHGGIVSKHMNKYPVVSLTLKDVEGNTHDNAIESIRGLISEVYLENMLLYESDRLNELQKKQFYRYCSKESTETELKAALKFLTACMQAYHGKRVIVLIDEYDTPIDTSVRYGYYEDMIRFMRGFLGSAFKTNDCLEFGVLTGVQRISKESLVSSFNNPKVCGVMDKDFATCFGFTEEEVKTACALYGAGGRFSEVKRWYDGYRFGGKDIYNPWSISRHLDSQEFDNYWVNTGSVGILRDVFFKGDDSLRNDMAGLLTGSPVMMSLEEGITYPIKYARSDEFWTMLLNAGYIKPCNGAKAERFAAVLVNMEVGNVFSRYAKDWFAAQQPSVSESILEFVGHLLGGDAEAVSAALNDDLLNNPSSHDFKMENSYHMFVYGMLCAVSGDYLVYSNQEAGKGRSDCVIKPADKSKGAVIVEFKHVRKVPPGDLKEEARSGLRQIEEKAYVHDLKREGYGRILKYGIAFHKKSCEVALEISTT